MEKKFVQIDLPFSVSCNALYGGGSGQRRFPSKKLKAWWEKLEPQIAHEFESVTIWYKFYFPDARIRDTSNYQKCVLDYLVKQKIILDDNWTIVNDERITPMGIDRKNPRVEVIIYYE